MIIDKVYNYIMFDVVDGELVIYSPNLAKQVKGKLNNNGTLTIII